MIECPYNMEKSVPPKPYLKGKKKGNDVILTWNVCLLNHHATIRSYRVFAYQETANPLDVLLWKKVGEVPALPLPMACNITQFVDRKRYHFAVQAVDILNRTGPLSDPISIIYDEYANNDTRPKIKHPAPHTKSPAYLHSMEKSIPPKPFLKGERKGNDIVLSWEMNLLDHHADISNYQVFVNEETDGSVDASLWRKVGNVPALPLPMACNISQFVDKKIYYFTVQAVDILNRTGPFSDSISIHYNENKRDNKS